MPDDFESNFNEGLQLFNNKQFDDAIHRFKDAVFLNPKSAEAHFFLGCSIIESETDNDTRESLDEKEEAAIKELKIAVELNPKDPEAYYFLGRSLCDIPTSYKEGLAILKTAITLDPQNEKYKRYIVYVFLLYNLVDEGILFIREHIRKEPKNAHNRRLLAWLLESKGLYEEAIIAKKETLILEPYKAENYLTVSRNLKRIGRIDEARLLLEGAVQSFPDDEPLKKEYESILIEKIVDLCDKKTWDDAIDTFQALIVNEEKRYSYNDGFGNKCGSSPITEILWKAFEEKKHRIDGIDLFLRLYSSDPGNISLSSNLEKSLKDLKINEDFIDDYLDSIRQYEDCADIHLNLANEIRFESGYEDIVIEEYRKAIILDPNLGFPHCEIGMILSQSYSKNKEAIQEFFEGIKKDPNPSHLGIYYYIFAITLIEENRTDEAITFFYKATELQPEDYQNFNNNILSHLYDNELFDKAEEFIKISIEIFEKMLKSGRKIQDFDLSYCCAQCSLGELFEKRGKYDEAISQYREAARIREDNAYPRSLLADLLFKKNLITSAIDEYRELIGLAAKHAPYHKKLADALMRNGQFLDAKQEYREAMRLDPDNDEYSETYLNLKTTLLDNEAFERAIQLSYNQNTLSSKDPSQFIEDEFQKLIANGENEAIEFKTSALWSKNYTVEQIEKSNDKDVKKFGTYTSKIMIAKTIAGFLNSDGGNLVIGIKENKDGNSNNITGIESEFSKLKDPCTDGYRRMITDEIIQKFFPDEIFHHLSNYIKIEFPKCESKNICWLKIKKSENPVYLKNKEDDFFYVRIDATTRQLAGKAATDYCLKHFRG